MDLNYLYLRQQVSRFNAHNAACDDSRRAHSEMAEAYGALIAEARKGAVVELRPCYRLRLGARRPTSWAGRRRRAGSLR
jgi:hypothetical protein